MLWPSQQGTAGDERRVRRWVEAALEHFRVEPRVARVATDAVNGCRAELDFGAGGARTGDVLVLTLRRVRRIEAIVDEIDEALMKVGRADGQRTRGDVVLEPRFPARRALGTEVGIRRRKRCRERLEERWLAKGGANAPSHAERARQNARGRGPVRREVAVGAAVVEARAEGARRQAGGADDLGVSGIVAPVVVRRRLVLTLGDTANREH